MSRLLTLLLLCSLASSLGCKKEEPKAAPTPPRVAASKLTVLVVDDAPLAAGIKLLRGEWTERSGGQIEIIEWTTDELLAAKELPADLIVYPSRYVGTLVDRNWLRPVRDSVLKNLDVDLDDVLPLLRNATLRYGNNIYALSLGEPPLMYALDEANADSADNFSWMEISNPDDQKSSQLRFPYAATLLLRGLAYSRYQTGEAGWFDAETLHPRISEPPYKKALQEMIGSVAPSAWSQLNGTLGWPHSEAKASTYAAFPTAKEVYNPVRGVWETSDSSEPITFLGFAGRSLSVTRSTRNSASAFKLLSWLALEEIATQLSPRSRATLWFRKSQASKAQRWLGENSDDQTAAAAKKLLDSSRVFLLPRIIQLDDYLEMLDTALRKAVAEQDFEVLTQVAAEWNTLTDRIGRQRQRAAYRRHLGLDDSNE